MPHFLAYSRLDGRDENRVTVEGHFDGRADAVAQLRYATRQRHGCVALPMGERIEDCGESELDQLVRELAGMEDELLIAKQDHTQWAAQLESRIEQTQRAIFNMREEINRENSR